MTVIETLKQRSSELVDLYHMMALLQWDQEVYLPAGAVAARTSQMGTISGIVHRKEVATQLGDLLRKAEDTLDQLSGEERALVRVMRRSYDQNTRLPEEFVVAFSRLTSQALQVWVKARRQSDFSLFEPVLEKLVEMSRQKAAYLGYAEEPYDALLDLHEEGLTAAKVDGIFTDLTPSLVAMLDRARQTEPPALQIDPPFDRAAQAAFAEKVLAAIGFDFARGRQDQSAHPFTTSLGHDDRRVTNRYGPRSLEFIFSALHEGGHALYEQGIAAEYSQSHLDTGVSLGVHESQSRLWENVIGRSLPFWRHFYPELQAAFPAQFAGLARDDFVRAVNAVRPGPIRVEADELCYNLHILVRFELERALISSDLQVRDLPVLWNEKYRQYLAVDVDADANGVLQDVHWAHGSFGYFPTYTIGNLAAAQFWAAYCRFDPDHRQTVASGNLGSIRSWLTENIYRHGSVYPPEQLIRNVTGEGLQPAYFVDYLQEKFFG